MKSLPVHSLFPISLLSFTLLPQMVVFPFSLFINFYYFSKISADGDSLQKPPLSPRLGLIAPSSNTPDLCRLGLYYSTHFILPCGGVSCLWICFHVGCEVLESSSHRAQCRVLGSGVRRCSVHFIKKSHTHLMVLPPFRSMIFYIRISLNTLQDVLQVWSGLIITKHYELGWQKLL